VKAEFPEKSLPPALARIISGYEWRQNNLGFSTAQVFRLEASDKNSLYLKIDARASKFSLRQERRRLDWLGNRLPAPEVLLFTADENHEYLLLSEIPGTDASHDFLKNDIPRIVEQLVSGLKMIHAVPIENCPFDERNESKIESVRKLVGNNLIDEDDFEEIHRGKTAADLFRETLAAEPFDEDLVFTHGDYCVPNVILENGRLSGFVDWGNAGIADRFHDLALLTRSITDNFGAEYEASIFAAYGIAPDWKKIRFYQLLDEFF